MVSMVLVMTVNPGYGGQTLIRSTLQKVRELADLRSSLGLSFEIQVDGGVTIENVHEYAAAGADVIVAGTACLARRSRSGSRAATLASRARQKWPDWPSAWASILPIRLAFSVLIGSAHRLPQVCSLCDRAIISQDYANGFDISAPK